MICERCGSEYSGNSCWKCQWEMNWGDVHEKEPQVKKMIRALDIPPPMNYDPKRCTGNFRGSKGETYDTTLFNCTCIDYMRGVRMRHTFPCKHIYRLAYECGAIPTPTKKELNKKLCFKLTFDIHDERIPSIGIKPRRTSKSLYMADRVISDILSLWYSHDKYIGLASEKAKCFLDDVPDTILEAIFEDLSNFTSLSMEEVEGIAKTLIWLKEHQDEGGTSIKIKWTSNS